MPSTTSAATATTLRSIFSSSSSSSKPAAPLQQQQQRILFVSNLQQYSSAIDKKFSRGASKNAETAKSAFRALDQQVRSHFFTLDSVASSKAEEIKQLVLRVVKWKLSRGQFRPTLYAQASSNEAKLVHECLLKAIEGLEKEAVPLFLLSQSAPTCSEEEGDVVEKLASAQYNAVDALSSKLKGIGPATATAILSQVKVSAGISGDGGVCPFMADEALEVVNDGKVEYTKKACISFLTGIDKKWMELFASKKKDLNSASKSPKRRQRGGEDAVDGEGEESLVLSPAQMSHALWVDAVLNRQK